MKPKEIQDLIDFIAQSGLQEVNIETDEFKLKVKKNVEAKTVTANPIIAAPPSPPAAVPSAAPAANEGDEAQVSQTESNNHVTVKSPMIGTFYRSSSPEAEPFVKVGDQISSGDPVCIVEAMKLFNEIESEISGTIVKVLVENATPVEFDQDLFLVDPS